MPLSPLGGVDPTPSQLWGVLTAQPGSGNPPRQPLPELRGHRGSRTSVHGLVVPHAGEGDAVVGALLAPLAPLAPHQQRAGALAVHQALPAVLLVALQRPGARGHRCCLPVRLLGDTGRGE